MADNTDNLVSNAAEKPKKVSTDAGSVDNRSIDELITAERHIASKNRTGLGIKFTRLIPSGVND